MRQFGQAKTQVSGTLTRAGMNATLQAMKKAVEETPPIVNSLRGTSTRTGEMKQHWVTDNRPKPIWQGGSYVSEFNSDKQYASFVNDGHRMDHHSVPGLVTNPGSGLLEFNLDGMSGIMIGTRTAHVPGLFMIDKAVEEYRRVLREELKGLEELTE